MESMNPKASLSNKYTVCHFLHHFRVGEREQEETMSKLGSRTWKLQRGNDGIIVTGSGKKRRES